jgi:cytoskeletal protein RodZ
MAYTIVRGVAGRTMSYSLRQGLNRRLAERLGKRSLWIMPLAVVGTLGVLSLTSHTWSGTDKPVTTPTTQHQAASAALSTPGESPDKSAAKPSAAANSAGGGNDSTAAAAPAATSSSSNTLRTTASLPWSPVIGGKGADITAPSTTGDTGTGTTSTAPTGSDSGATVDPQPSPSDDSSLICTPGLIDLVQNMCLP